MHHLANKDKHRARLLRHYPREDEFAREWETFIARSAAARTPSGKEMARKLCQADKLYGRVEKVIITETDFYGCARVLLWLLYLVLVSICTLDPGMLRNV